MATRKKSTAKRTAKRKTTATRAVPKRVVKRKTTAKRTTVGANLRVRPKPRVRPKLKPQSDGLNGSKTVAKLVKAAKKEGEKAVMKKVLKSKKAQADKVLKSSKAKINRLLKENKTRITEILRSSGTKRRRKTVIKPRKRIDSPFDARRFRGNRRRKKKETNDERLKRVSEHVHSVRDQILYGIADGSFKFKWASVAKEAGYGTGERKAMLSILDNKGYTINKLAHKIWEDNNGSYGHVKDDDLIRDEIIDVLQTVSTRKDAFNQLDKWDGNPPPF
jgi:cell division septum initiation protein DivIVA